MTSVSRIPFFAFWMLFVTGVAPSWCASIQKVDTSTIHELYMDGEFDPAIKILETDLTSGKILSHGDSAFIYKHLGVMYAAQYETREKGKLYMHQLLMVEPTASIMDMYASNMIYMIFRNIQDEFQTKRARVEFHKDNVLSGGSKQSSKKKLIWIGTAAVVIGLGTWLLIAAMTASSSGTQYQM